MSSQFKLNPIYKVYMYGSMAFVILCMYMYIYLIHIYMYTASGAFITLSIPSNTSYLAIWDRMAMKFGIQEDTKFNCKHLFKIIMLQQCGFPKLGHI